MCQRSTTGSFLIVIKLCSHCHMAVCIFDDIIIRCNRIAPCICHRIAFCIHKCSRLRFDLYRISLRILNRFYFSTIIFDGYCITCRILDRGTGIIATRIFYITHGKCNLAFTVRIRIGLADIIFLRGFC